MSKSKWKTYKIGKLGRIITGKTPSTQEQKNFGDKYPFITPKDMTGQKKVYSTQRYLSEQGKLVVKNCLLPPNAVCVSCIGSDMGKVVMTTQDSITNQQLNSIICSSEFNPNFIYYSIKRLSNEFQNTARHSTAVPILNKTAFSEFELNIPDMCTQTRIADFLSTLDDKIELNHQTIITIDTMDQVLFREFFIDYRFPDVSEKTLDNDIGFIPKEWKVYKLGELIDSVSVTHKFDKDEVIFLNTSDIEKGRILHHNFSKVEQLPGQAKKSIQKMDILFTEIRPGNKRFALIDFDAKDYVVSTKLMVLRMRADIHPIVIYNYLTSNKILKAMKRKDVKSSPYPVCRCFFF